jgi:copper chaperone NosL
MWAFSPKLIFMKLLSIILLSALVSMSCSVGPEPIQFGKDSCHHCKMIIMDQKFGSEIVTAKGKIYKFDDFNCMVNFMDEGTVNQDQLKHVLVIDFGNPGNLIDAYNAGYIHSEEIRSPMGSRLAAFSSKDKQQEFSQQWQGQLLGWAQSYDLFKNNQQHNHHH